MNYQEKIRRWFREYRYDDWGKNVPGEFVLPHWLACGCGEPLRHLLVEESGMD